ncbi:MAG: phosphate-starvation-inducible PsiE family protein [Candidatus Omnitrophica bacterium]|nr:phosphate-starvation-inducible PsiE family protein [Candidatus Omnitrophota bacterium]
MEDFQSEQEVFVDRAHDSPLIRKLEAAIRVAVRALAVLMTVVIILGVVDVIWVLYEKLMSPPKFLLQISDILATFGAFMAVLIAIEIFVNITIYLREDVIHVKIVMATALMAIARKVIILDMKEVQAADLWGLAGVVLATSIAYWIVVVSPGKESSSGATKLH